MVDIFALLIVLILINGLRIGFLFFNLKLLLKSLDRVAFLHRPLLVLLDSLKNALNLVLSLVESLLLALTILRCVELPIEKFL